MQGIEENKIKEKTNALPEKTGIRKTVSGELAHNFRCENLSKCHFI